MTDHVAYKKLCWKCAQKLGREEEYRKSYLHTLAKMGRVSVCDFCGEENGGACVRSREHDKPR